MFDKATVVRFVEAFVAVFVVSFAADPIFSGGSVSLFGADGLHALEVAIISAAVLAARRALAAK